MRRLLFSLTFTLALLAASAPASAQEAEEDLGPAVGSEAPDFTLSTLDGEEVSLSEFRGESPVVLVFFRGEW